MPKIKVQERLIKSEGKTYSQLWITLPKTIAEAMKIDKGSELKVFVERGDLVLRLA